MLRAKQLCGLKFRRQHPIGPWFADFACPERMPVVEIDGGYHDEIVEQDLKRQRQIEQLGWRVLRVTAEDVEQDAEAVARGIASEVGLPFEFQRRKATGSGMMNLKSTKRDRPT